MVVHTELNLNAKEPNQDKMQQFQNIMTQIIQNAMENRINNCQEYDLSSGVTQAKVDDIDVLNGIVVCCGYERSATGSNIPKLWINGSEYSLGEQLNNYSNVRPCAVAIVKR